MFMNDLYFALKKNSESVKVGIQTLSDADFKVIASMVARDQERRAVQAQANHLRLKAERLLREAVVLENKADCFF